MPAVRGTSTVDAQRAVFMLPPPDIVRCEGRVSMRTWRGEVEDTDRSGRDQIRLEGQATILIPKFGGRIAAFDRSDDESDLFLTN